MVNRVILRLTVRSALTCIVVYIAVVLVGALVLGGLASQALRVGPQALTLLFTGISLLGRLVAMFTAGFVFGKHSAEGGIWSMVLVGIGSAVFLFLFDMVWLAPAGIAAPMLRALAASPLMNLALGLGVLGLHIGVCVLGGVIGRHTRDTTKQAS